MGFSINKRTNTDKKDSSLCTDLIFNDLANLSVNTGVHASLYPNYHHQLVHSSFNLNICYSHHINAKYEITKTRIQPT